MSKNIGKRLIISLLLCVVAIAIFVQSNSEKVQLCGTWTGSDTYTTNYSYNMYERYEIEQTFRFSIFGTFKARAFITSETHIPGKEVNQQNEEQTIKGKYNIKNGKLTIEANGQIAQTEYRLVGNSLAGENGEPLRRQSDNHLPLIMKLISGVLILIAIVLFGKNRKADVVSSEPADVL